MQAPNIKPRTTVAIVASIFQIIAVVPIILTAITLSIVFTFLTSERFNASAIAMAGLYVSFFMVLYAVRRITLVSFARKIARMAKDFGGRVPVESAAANLGVPPAKLYGDIGRIFSRRYITAAWVDLWRREIVFANARPPDAKPLGDMAFKEVSSRAAMLPLVLLAGTWVVAYAMFDLTDMKSLVAAAALSAAAAAAAFFMSPKSTRLADVPRRPETPQARKAAEGAGGEARDDRLDGAIAGLVEMGKISRQLARTKIGPQVLQMTQTTQEILEQVKADPEKMRGLRQFFGYFLPTSIDLLRKYASLSARQVKTDNIINSIRRIEDSIDNIAAVFRKEFDNLFMDEAVDISAEITVMEGMLVSEGDFGGAPGRRSAN